MRHFLWLVVPVRDAVMGVVYRGCVSKVGETGDTVFKIVPRMPTRTKILLLLSSFQSYSYS